MITYRSMHSHSLEANIEIRHMLYYFFWSLYCLSLSDLWFPIASLVSSYFFSFIYFLFFALNYATCMYYF